MKLLLIDTCGATGSVALAEATTILASASLPGRTASERLVATIKDLAERAGVPLQSLDAIGVVHGPGSFTGVRVGLSAAKGLCEALNIPLVAISRLAVLAHLAAAPPGKRVDALLDAGRGDFYLGTYLDGSRIREALVTREELLASVELPDLIVTCEPMLAESLGALTPQFLAEPIAADALPLVLSRIQADAFDNPNTIDANYLRRTDAEIFAKPIPKSAREIPVR